MLQTRLEQKKNRHSNNSISTTHLVNLLLFSTQQFYRHQYFDHGTGHGVGSFLSVHEGPQALSRQNNVPLEPGMIISNEPGYYKKNSYGIRIENLIYVREISKERSRDGRIMMEFETLTMAPIDKNIIECSLLSELEKKWLNNYHSIVYKKLNPILTKSAQKWLKTACEPI